VELAVVDTGVGMSEAVRTRVFEPFFTTKGPGCGTGLGLATVYGIVSQAGGGIRVESQLDTGTTFRILLPAIVATATPPAHASRDSASGHETILVVEDEEAVRTMIRRALERQGYVVLAASGAAAAIETAERYSGPIDLLLTDVVMPDRGGRELADAIRARRPGLRVVYMSGYTDDAVVRHGIETSTDAFLQKPFSPSLLSRKLRSVLDEAGSPTAGGRDRR
jgi:CheY-like chemotaxis protein